MLVMSLSGRDYELYSEWCGRLSQRRCRVTPVGFFRGSTRFICSFRTDPSQLKLDNFSFLSLSCRYYSYLAYLVLVRTNFLISLGEVVMISVNFFISATQKRFLVWNYYIRPTTRFYSPVFYYLMQKSSFFSYQLTFQSYYSCLVALVFFLGSYYLNNLIRVDYLPRTVISTYFYYNCSLKCSYTTFLRIIYEFSNILWMFGELPTSSNQLKVSSFMEAILICVFMKSIKDILALFLIQCRLNFPFSRSVMSSSEGRLLSNRFLLQLREAYFQRKDLLTLLYQPFGVTVLLCIIILFLIIIKVIAICQNHPDNSRGEWDMSLVFRLDWIDQNCINLIENQLFCDSKQTPIQSIYLHSIDLDPWELKTSSNATFISQWRLKCTLRNLPLTSRMNESKAFNSSKQSGTLIVFNRIFQRICPISFSNKHFSLMSMTAFGLLIRPLSFSIRIVAFSIYFFVISWEKICARSIPSLLIIMTMIKFWLLVHGAFMLTFYPPAAHPRPLIVQMFNLSIFKKKTFPVD